MPTVSKERTEFINKTLADHGFGRRDIKPSSPEIKHSTFVRTDERSIWEITNEKFPGGHLRSAGQ